MTRILFAASAAILALATPAIARDGERSFTREGVTYVYTVKQADDVRVLEGKASQGNPFRLVVKNGWVQGIIGNTRVSFREPANQASASTGR